MLLWDVSFPAQYPVSETEQPFDDDIARGHLSAACFIVPRHNFFNFIFIRFENLKINLTDAAYFSIWSYFKKIPGHLNVLAPNTQ